MSMDSPGEREFRRASTIGEAASILAEEDAIIISGGQSLMPLLRQGMIDTEVVVDISGIDDHDDIRVGDDELHVGGIVTHHDLIRSDVAGTPWRALVNTARTIGDRQVRNWGTIGGAIAHGDPSLDYPPTMTVLDTFVEVSNGEDVREIPIDELYIGPFTTALERDEIVIGVRSPRPPVSSGVRFEKFSWRKGDMALVNVAALVTTDGRGEITDARICIGSVVPRPTRLSELEEKLIGTAVDDRERQAAVSASVPEYIDPVSESHASVEYKNRLAINLTRSALRGASVDAREAAL